MTWTEFLARAFIAWLSLGLLAIACSDRVPGKHIPKRRKVVSLSDYRNCERRSHGLAD